MLKDRKQKRKQVGGDTEESSSKHRVQKHLALKFKLAFKSKKQKVNRVAQTFNTSLSLLSALSKVKAYTYAPVCYQPRNPTCQKAY